jgi:hypothetical protein
MKLRTLITGLIGGIAVVGALIGGIALTVSATTATFSAVAAMSVPIIVAYIAAATVLGNVLSLVTAGVWLLCIAVAGLLTAIEGKPLHA